MRSQIRSALLVGASLVMGTASPVFAQGAPAAAASASAAARPAAIPTSAFASRAAFSVLRVSPDGKLIATRGKLGNKQFVAIIDAATQKLVRRLGVGEDNEITQIRWAGSDKLLVSLFATRSYLNNEVSATRLAYVNLTNGQMELLGNFSTADGDDVIFIPEDGSYALVSVQRTKYQYPAVVRYGFADNKVITTIVQDPIEGVWDWYADNDGVVRLGLGMKARDLQVHYRSGPGDKFRVVEKIRDKDVEDKYLHVSYIRAGSDTAYVLREDDSGRVALWTFDLATRQPLELVYANPDHDIDSVLFRKGKPVGAFWTEDVDKVHWFDPSYAANFSALTGALKDEQVWVVSRSEDSSRQLVWAGGPGDPGAYYVFTPGAGQLSLLMEERAQIDETALVRPEAITYTARDGTKIRAMLALPRGRAAKDLPLVILPHGGPYGVFDKLEYSDEVQLLANRGYAVLQPNFRGSGGYGEDFVELGSGQIGRKMQDDIDDAMDWAVGKGLADKDRVCVVGSSYGGYAALWSVIRNPERYRCAASFAGVTDWDLILKYDSQFFKRWADKKWQEKIEGEEKFDLDTVSPYRLAGTLTRPVLIAHGKEDSRVPFSQFTKFRNAAAKASVQPVELVFEEEGHGFDKPENEQKWYDALTAFLAANNPAD